MKNRLKEDLIVALKSETGLPREEIDRLLEVPKNPDHGNLSFPCFQLARTWKLAPPACAEKLKTSLKLPQGIASVETVGPFLNFCFDSEYFIAEVLRENLSGRSAAADNKQTCVVIEYSSPNIAKPFHVGHLRATLIGNCLDRVYRHRNYKTISVNHLGDWGTQFGFVWAGCKLWGKPKEESVTALVDLYRQATALKATQEKGDSADKTLPDVNELARGFFIDLEDGKEYAVEFWSWCREISIRYLEETYKRLNVKFDHWLGEAFYSDKLDAVKEEIEKAGILTESQGALGVQLSEQLGFARIYTPDGRSLYLTRDIATAEYRAKTYNFDKAIYVVGMPQTLHFQQLIGVLQALKKSYADQIVHVAFGHVMGMKTRGEGDFIELNEFLDEAYDRSLEAYRSQVAKRPEGLDEKEVAYAVSLSAIMFSTLSRSRLKDVHFSWDHALEFQGDSGPYLLYACARINGIREKVKAEGIVASAQVDASLLTEASALALAVLVDEFGEVLDRTIAENEPAVLCAYALDLAKGFSRAYLDLKVSGVDKALATARFSLFEATHRTLETALTLLGMKTLARM